MTLRDDFPMTARFGDHVRKTFPEARTVWTQEKGKEYGKREGVPVEARPDFGSK